MGQVANLQVISDQRYWVVGEGDNYDNHTSDNRGIYRKQTRKHVESTGLIIIIVGQVANLQVISDQSRDNSSVRIWAKY